jgi:hypothetical protein
MGWIPVINETCAGRVMLMTEKAWSKTTALPASSSREGGRSARVAVERQMVSSQGVDDDEDDVAARRSRVAPARHERGDRKGEEDSCVSESPGARPRDS